MSQKPITDRAAGVSRRDVLRTAGGVTAALAATGARAETGVAAAPARPPRSFDAIVVGMGAVGSATVYQLAKRGVKVLGLERFAVPHSMGGTHGNSRQTKLAAFEGGPYEPIIRRAYGLWEQLVEESGQKDVMVTTGFLDLFPGDASTPPGRGAYARDTGLYERLPPDEVARRYPQFRFEQPFWGYLDPKGALLRPELAITTHVRLAMQRGAVVEGSTEVKSWRADGGGVSVETTRGTFTAQKLVLCAGPWMGKLAADLGIRMTANRQSFAWAWPLRNAPAYGPETMPCWCLQDSPGAKYGGPYYGFPMMTDVPGFKIGLHWAGEPVDPDAFDRTPNADDEELVRFALRKYLPDADGPLLGIRTCLYDNTPDGTPIIDVHPGHDRVVLCGPLCGAGFKFSPAYAEATADLAATGTTKLPIGFLRVGRLLKGVTR